MSSDPSSPAERESPLSRLAAALHRPVFAAAALLLVYAALSLLTNPGGYLGTDTGAKIATLDVMAERGTARPGLGYWAEDYDPEGVLHPIYDSRPVDGDWVHVTTLPMLEAGLPLYALGGYRLALLLPMLGAVGAAFGARALATRDSGERAGWVAFYTVGLLSPMVLYALDFWEHAPGVACIVGATALLAGIVDGDRVLARALGAGALLGLAATMRTESFTYALVAVGLCSAITLATHRSLRRSIMIGLLCIAGFAVPWLGNQLLESQLGGNSRAGRVGGAAGRGASRVTERLQEAVITLLSTRSTDVATVLVGGGLFALLVAAAVLASRHRRNHLVIPLLGLAALLQVATLAGGLGFIPGMVAAAPIVVVAVLTPGPTVGARYTLAVALIALPLVWAFQLLGGAGPQWAGRYALTSCILLVALGAAQLTRATRALRLGLFTLSALVTISGVAWLSYRSHEVDSFFERLVDRPEDVVISRNGFFLREGGAAYSDRLWLTAVSDQQLEHAVEVVAESGHSTFAVIDRTPTASTIPGAELVATEHAPVFGEDLYLHSYLLESG
ncbi:MAG: hypothetical protein ABWZ52_08895 [Acidimicrobiales bacterium]